MSKKWALTAVVAAVLGILLLVLGGWTSAFASPVAATVAATDASTHTPDLSISPDAVASTQDEGEVTNHTVSLSNASAEAISYTVSTGGSFVPFASGRTFYGYNPVYWMELRVVGLEDDTSVVVTNLADGSTIDSAVDLDRYGTLRIDLPDRTAYKVTSDKAVVAYQSQFTGWSHNTFMPSVDSGAVGTEFIFYLNAITNGSYAGRFYVIALEDADVEIFNASGQQVWNESLSANSYMSIYRYSGVYHVRSTGRIVLQTAVENGYTLVPSAGSAGSGTTFYFAMHEGSYRTGFAVFAYEEADVQVYDLDTGDLLWEKSMAKGELWWNSDLGTRRLRLESSAVVEVWAGSMEGGSDIQGLGDDISFAGGHNGREHYVHSLWDGSVIFAPYDDTVVTIDGAEQTLQADDYLLLEGCCYYRHILSNRPVVIMTLGSANWAFNDVGTYLSGYDGTPDSCSWLELSHTEGEVPGSGTSDLGLTIDSTGIPPGDYTCDVAVLPSMSQDVAMLEVSLTVNNHAPGFASSPALDVAEDAGYLYGVITTDPDVGDTRSVTATVKPVWLTLDDHGDGTADLHGTPRNEHVGAHPIQLDVSDATGAAATQSFTLTVTNTNDAPRFSSWPDWDATEDEEYEYHVATEDVDVGDSLAISLTLGPDWLEIVDHGDGTARLHGTPANVDVGDHAVSLSVTDLAGAMDAQDFTLSVFNTNDAPYFTSTPRRQALLNESYRYDIETADVDLGDSRVIEIPVRPSWLLLTDHGDGTATLSGTPTAGDAGNHVVSLVVRDAGGLSNEQNFTITAAEEFPETGSIEGQIFDDRDGDGQVDEGEGVAGATVTITAIQSASDHDSVLSDENGEFRMDEVLVGTYALTVSAPGYDDPAPVEVTVERDAVASVEPISITRQGSAPSQYLPNVQRTP